eukprot:214072-Prymnesium_polylepis.1
MANVGAAAHVCPHAHPLRPHGAALLHVHHRRRAPVLPHRSDRLRPRRPHVRARARRKQREGHLLRATHRPLHPAPPHPVPPLPPPSHSTSFPDFPRTPRRPPSHVTPS